MKAHTVKPLRITLFALFACIASAAQATMYKWTDADGNTTFSNQPPADTANVRDLTRIEDASDKRSNAGPAEKEKRGGESAIAQPQPPSAAPAQPAARTEPSPMRPQAPAASAETPAARPAPSPELTRPEPSLTRPGPSPGWIEPSPKPEAASSSREPNAAKRESETSPRASNRRVETEAVRDPCLRSSDPKCHERHRNHYHPYFGYAPSVTQPGSPTAVGATGATGAGGSVGAQIGASPSSTPAPRRSDSVPAAVNGSLRLQ